MAFRSVAKLCPAQSRAFVLPFVKDLEVVSSTVVSAMVRCRVINSGFLQVRCAVTSGRVLGLRIFRAACIVEGDRTGGRPGEAHDGLYKQKVAAASFTVALQHAPVLTERCGGSSLEKCEKDSSVFQIFVRDRLCGFPAKLLVMSCLLLSLMQRVFLLSSFI